jgi:hypothetical protein
MRYMWEMFLAAIFFLWVRQWIAKKWNSFLFRFLFWNRCAMIYSVGLALFTNQSNKSNSFSWFVSNWNWIRRIGVIKRSEGESDVKGEGIRDVRTRQWIPRDMKKLMTADDTIDYEFWNQKWLLMTSFMRWIRRWVWRARMRVIKYEKNVSLLKWEEREFPTERNEDSRFLLILFWSSFDYGVATDAFDSVVQLERFL